MIPLVKVKLLITVFLIFFHLQIQDKGSSMKKIISLTFLISSFFILENSIQAGDLNLLLPLNRVNYQTNELIDIAVVRSDKAILNAGKLNLVVKGEDGSLMNFVFPTKSVALIEGKAQSVEHLRLNGWMLRPGNYLISAETDGNKAQAKISVFSHLRKTSYRLIHWGGSRNNMMAVEGEDGMGFNLAWGEVGESSIPSGQDVMGSCLMGGGHQHDLKNTNDWSDPNVYIGAIQRGVDRAFGFRTMPNAIGAHLHDEPGLTWLPHPTLKDKDGKPVTGPHDISFQRTAYKRAFGEEMAFFDKTDTKTPAGMAQWEKANDFKLGFMDAFWKSSRHALEKMKPGYLPVTQSQYGWMALYDGYYFNVARSMPVVSGHGGYCDYWLYNLNPSMYVELSMPRQFDKPTWYLPHWGSVDSDGLRQTQNLSFITGIQGIATWPGMNIDSPHASGVIETNKTFARLGTIFTKPMVTRQPLAILYSKSNTYFNKEHTQLQDLSILYVATRLTQYPVSFVLDEDILDGTISAEHKAVVIAGVNYLDPAVITGLTDFTAKGGVVLTTSDTTISIPGAVKLDITPDALVKSAQENSNNLTDATLASSAKAKVNSFRGYLEFAEPTAKALQKALQAKGIAPAFESSLSTIAPGRQVRGEIEYLFGVNLTPKEGYNGFGIPIAASTILALQDDGRPIYNAVTSLPVSFEKKGSQLISTVEFGPGQMLALARPARPIGGIQVTIPIISRDLTREAEPPIRLNFSATLVDTQQKIIAGSAPLQITITDSLGQVRYDLYRATENGVCNISLPLAINDAAGKWQIVVQDLLANTKGEASFVFDKITQAGALAGISRRAIFYTHDTPNFYNFFRSHRQISIVTGTSTFSLVAAQRLAASLKPYNVNATIITSADANKARILSDEEAKTWCGSLIAGSLDINARNNPILVGYNLPQPSILLGNPQDNPLIKRLLDAKVLPYTPSADFPGQGRGMLAWNLMTLGHDVETIACIAQDAEGLNESVGTLFTIMAGIDPVTPLALPLSSSILQANQPSNKIPLPVTLWKSSLPDRIAFLANTTNGCKAIAINGTSITFDALGKTLATSTKEIIPQVLKLSTDINQLPKDKLRSEFKLKQVLNSKGGTAVIYWGGRLQIFDASNILKAEQQLHQDVSSILWHNDLLMVGLADGTLLGLRP